MKNITLTPEEQLVLASMKLKPTAEELARMERMVAEVLFKMNPIGNKFNQ